MEEQQQYYAFISYKREDKKEAKRLQHALEYYRLPNHLRLDNPELPEYVRPVFRDMTDLEVGELSAQIHSALEQSHYLIVVCSPQSAASKWVNDEVEYFISLGKQDKIIPYIIDGVPHANNPAEECYPPALLRLSQEKELLGANINEVGKDSATIRVVSRMFNIRFDTLYQRYQREVKKRRRQLAVAIILAFLFLTGIAGWIWHQNLLLKEREWNMMVNQARAVAEKANQLTDNGDLTSAMMICMEIMPDKTVNSNRPLVPELLSAFYGAFYKYLLEDKRPICHIPTIDFHYNDDDDFGIVPGNQYVWACSESNANINLFDIQSGKLIHSKLKGGCYNGNQFSSDGKYYVSIDENESRIILQHVSSGNIIHRSKKLGDNRLWNLSFNSTNTEVFVEQNGVGIRCLTIPSLDESYLISDMPAYWYVNEKSNLFGDFDSYAVWVGSKDTGNVIYEINDHINTCCFSDSLFAVSLSENNSVNIYEFQTGTFRKTIKSSETIDVMRFSRDMRYLMLINREVCRMDVFDLLYDKKITIALPNDIRSYSIDIDHDYLVFSSDKDNSAYKYVYNSDSLVNCTYFEAFPDRPYRVMREGKQPNVKVYRAEAPEPITIERVANYPYLIEGEGYCLIDYDNSEVRYDWVCEISDSIALCVPSDFSSLVLYNKYQRKTDLLRINAQDDYSIPVNLFNNECFAVFTKDSLVLYDRQSLEIQGGSKIATSRTRPNHLYEFKCCPNGEYIIRDENNNYCIYNKMGKVITTIDGATYENIDFSPSGQFLTCWKSSSSNTTLCILCTQTGEMVYEFEIPVWQKLVSFDEEEKTFAFLYGTKNVAVFDIERKKLINTFYGIAEEINDIALSPSGKYLLITCPREKRVDLWDVETNALLFSFKDDDIYSVRFSEDEKSLVMSTNQGEIEKFHSYAHSEIITKHIPFYSLEELLLKAKEILCNRRVNSNERKMYYLE